jgi:hypothetical protein
MKDLEIGYKKNSTFIPSLTHISMKNLIFFLLCCFAIKSYSQDEKSFLVIKVKGTCYYNRDKFKIPLKIGTYLSINDEVTIGKSSSASLVCNNNKLFTINNALQTISPKISLKKYQDSCVTLKQSVSADFIKYVLFEFNSLEDYLCYGIFFLMKFIYYIL